MQWQFPLGVRHITRIKTIDAVLPTGDYALMGFEDVTLVERKGSIKELLECFHRTRKRQFMGPNGQLARMIQVPRPFLVIDVPSAMIYDTSRVPHPEYIVDDVMRLPLQYPTLGVHWFGDATGQQGRLLLGTYILRLLWNAVLMEKETFDK